jgi:NAD+ synthase (glutamine-hydrolysing)
MRIAIAQINATLGDVQSNKSKILEFIERAKQKKVDLLVFPESSLLGYHPFDLLERSDLIKDLEKSLKEIRRKVPANMAVIIGTMTRNLSRKGRPYFNSAILLQRGKAPREFHKQLLPTGDVFDEARFIEPGDLTKNQFQFKGKNFFLTICEDIWAWEDEKGYSFYAKNPLENIHLRDIDLVVNLSASPWFLGKEKLRRRVALKTAKHFKAPILYANLVGAQDEIIFDGASFILDPSNKVLMKCRAFEEDLNVFDLESREVWAKTAEVLEIEKLRKALVLGLQDFCGKVGIKKVHLGLSGGVDSAVVACLAVDALGAAHVRAFALPGPYSSPRSRRLAELLSKNLKLEISAIDITPAYKLLAQQLEEELGLDRFGVTHENLQSRLRGLVLMAYGNQTGSLLLTTGNKSEYATGYATLYGDMCGGLAPIGDLTKKQVYELAEYYNIHDEIIPAKIISRPPTAELRPNQKDQDSLPPYDQLDLAVTNIVEKSKAAKTPTEKWLIQRLVQTEFKRWQAAPILKVSSHSFGRGRRWPLAHRAFKENLKKP